MNDPRRAIGIGAAVMLALASGLVIGRVTVGGAPEEPADVGIGPTASPSLGPQNGSSSSPVKAPPAGSAPGPATFRARARSIQTTAAITGLRRAALQGAIGARVSSSSIVDARGRPVSGSVEIAGRTLKASSPDLELRAHTVTIRADGASVYGSSTPGALAGIAASYDDELVLLRGGTIAGDRIFTRDAQGKEQRVEGPVRVEGPATIDLEIGTQPLRWTDPPGRLRLAEAERAVISWAGPGTLGVRGSTRTVRYGGVYGVRTEARIERSGSTLVLEGTSNATQAFAEGRPVARTTARIEVEERTVTAKPGTRGEFTWIWRNTGAADMCIVREHGVTTAAHWVNSALSPLPVMFGGEKHAPVGGDATGVDPDCGWFGCAVPQESLIHAGHSNTRGVTFDVPSGTPRGSYPIVLEIRGNFPTVRTTVTVRVI